MMIEIGSKCPRCGEGPMQAVIDTTAITPRAIETQLRARCATCGHEEEARPSPES